MKFCVSISSSEISKVLSFLANKNMGLCAQLSFYKTKLSLENLNLNLEGKIKVEAIHLPKLELTKKPELNKKVKRNLW